jgi:hypothetical protein
VFDGTVDSLTGSSIDFAGPNYGGGPWTFTIDMGTEYTFTHWRVAGSTWYSFGNAYLNYEDYTTGTMTKIDGSAVEYDTNTGGLQSAAFSAPVTASRWQVYITSHANDDYQSQFQLYLTEVQFGIS